MSSWKLRSGKKKPLLYLKHKTPIREIFFNGGRILASSIRYGPKNQELHPYFKTIVQRSAIICWSRPCWRRTDLILARCQKDWFPHIKETYGNGLLKSTLWGSVLRGSRGRGSFAFYVFGKTSEYFKPNLRTSSIGSPEKHEKISTSVIPFKKTNRYLSGDWRQYSLRDAAGQLVFRPSGHGALLENLNE